MSIEAKPGLRKENSLAKLAAKVIEAVAAPKTPTGGHKEPGRFADLLKRLTDPVIKKENSLASRWTQLFTSENPASRSAAETSTKKEIYPKRTPEAAKRVVEQAAQFARDRKPDVPSWIPQNDTGEIKPQTALTAEFMLRVSTLPPELRTPQILYREAARLYHSADYKAMLKDPKLDPQVREINQYIDATLVEIQKQAEAHPEFKFKAEEPAVMRDKLSREFDIYRSRRLPPPQKVEGPKDPDDEGTAEWALEKRRDALDARLRRAQQTYDTLEFEGKKNDELKELLRLKQELEDDTVDATSKLEEWMWSKGKVAKYNDTDVEEYTKLIEQRIEILKRHEAWHPVEIEAPTLEEGRASFERPYAGLITMSTEDIAKLPKEAQEYWFSCERYINNASEGWVNEMTLMKFAEHLQYLSRRPDYTPEQQGYMSVFIEKLQSEIQRMRLDEQIPNQISPTKEEYIEMTKNPFGFMERFVREIEYIIAEEGPDSPKLQASFVRYKLLGDLFSSRFYNEKLLGPIPKGITGDQRAEFLSMREALSEAIFKGQIDTLAEYQNRIDHVQAIYMVNYVKDMEKDGQRFMEIITRLSDERAYAIRGYHGRLVDTFVNVYLQRQFRLRQIDLNHADPEKLTPDVLKEIWDDALKEFKADRDIWANDYNLFQRARYAKLPTRDGKPVIPIPEDFFQLTDTKLESAAIAGRSSARVFMQYKGWQNYGLTAQEGAKQGKQNEFWFTLSIEERFNRARYITWRRRWGSDDPQRAMLCAGAEMVLKRDKDVREFANMRSGDWWVHLQNIRNTPGIPGYRESHAEKVKRLTRIVTDPVNHPEQAKFYAQLQVAFSEYYKRQELGSNDEELVNFFLRIDEKRFKQQIAWDTAMVWQEENGGSRIYDVLKSVYVRQGAVKEELKGSSEDIIRKDLGTSEDIYLGDTLIASNTGGHAKDLCHGLSLYGPAMGWFFPNVHERSSEGKDVLLGKLAEAAWSHPHELALLEFEHEGPNNTRDYYDAKELKGTFGIFSRIQGLLMMRGCKQIDYRNQLVDARQAQVVDKVFKTMNVGEESMTPKQYFAVMKKYADRYHGKNGVERFTQMKYANRFREILWYDDMPLSSINTNKLKTQGPDRGAHGLVARAWTDTGIHGMRATDTIDHSLTFNEEEAIKAGLAARDTIKSYQSPADAAAAQAFTIGRHAGVGNRYVEITSLVKGGIYESIAQRLGTEADVARAPDETMEFLHKAQKGNKVGEASPYWEEGMMLEAKITDWRSKLGGSDGWVARMVGHRAFNNVVETLNDKLPTRWTTVRFGNTILFISAIGGIFVFAQAQKGGKEGAR